MLTEPAAVHLTQPYEGLTIAVYSLRIGKQGEASLVHPNGCDYAFGHDEIARLETAGILKRYYPKVTVAPARAPIESAAQRAAHLVQLKLASPMRPPAGRTHDVDGLALFDTARQPRLL